MKRSLFTSLLMIVVLTSGCTKKESPEEAVTSAPAPEEVKPVTVESTIKEAKAILAEGRTNDVFELLHKSVYSEELKDKQTEMFNSLIGFSLFAGEPVKAEAYFDEMLKKNPGIAYSNIVLMLNYHLQNQDYDATERLIAAYSGLPLPEDISKGLQITKLRLAVSRNDTESIILLLKAMVKENPEDISKIRFVFYTLTEKEQLDSYTKVRDALADIKAGDRKYSLLAAASDARMYLIKKEPKAAINLLIPLLDAEDLTDITGAVKLTVAKTDDKKLRERFIDDAINKSTFGGSVFKFAANRKLTDTFKSNDLNLWIDTAAEISSKGEIAPYLSQAFDKIVYAVINSNDKALMSKLGKMLKDIKVDPKNEIMQERSKIWKLDLSFTQEDFAECQKILEQGIPAHDEAWHKNLIIKTKAHLALSEDKHADAVKYFREFMETMGTEDISNPATGDLTPIELILAVNAKRIGDIWTSADEEEKAAKAYAEAKQLYTKALEKVADNPRLKAQINNAISELPSV